MKLVLASAAAVLTAAPALAEPDWYISAGYTAFDADDATLDALTARGGVFLNAHFGVEGEYSLGIGEEEISPFAELELSDQVAGYVVARLPVNERFDVRGRLGYGAADFDVNIDGLGSASTDVDGFLFGAAAEYAFTERVAGRLDYTRFEADEDDFDDGANILSAALVLRF